jgi:hypothetical protein
LRGINAQGVIQVLAAEAVGGEAGECGQGQGEEEAKADEGKGPSGVGFHWIEADGHAYGLSGVNHRVAFMAGRNPRIKAISECGLGRPWGNL